MLKIGSLSRLEVCNYLQSMLSKGERSQTAVLTIIVFAQLAGTSLWFAGNAILEGLSADLGLQDTALGPITSAVQLGFIAGTLVFAILTIADRFSPSKVFFASGLVGALMNSALVILDVGFPGLLALRFLTGFCLAGIYPVGMKIASDHFPQGLGKALGLLLGALALGTASPHLVRVLLADMPWKAVLLTTSVFCVLGGVAVLLLVPDGPNRKPAASLDFGAFFNVFRRIPSGRRHLAISGTCGSCMRFGRLCLSYCCTSMRRTMRAFQCRCGHS